MHMARAERKSTLQGSGLVRTKGPCAQSSLRVPRAIAIARDGLSNDRRKSATCFERPANTIISPPDHFLWGEGGEGSKMFVAA